MRKGVNMINWNKDYTYTDIDNGVLLGLCHKDGITYVDGEGVLIKESRGFRIKGSGAIYRRVIKHIKSDKMPKTNVIDGLHI